MMMMMILKFSLIVSYNISKCAFVCISKELPILNNPYSINDVKLRRVLVLVLRRVSIFILNLNANTVGRAPLLFGIVVICRITLL